MGDWSKLYKTKEWKRLRRNQLYKEPMCQCPHCNRHGLVADTVDHITPHKGDRKLFLDRNNLQSLAASCHNKYKQSQEKGGKGFDQGCDERGFPLNRDHFWNAEKA